MENFVRGMLTNISQLPLQGIHNKLTLFSTAAAAAAAAAAVVACIASPVCVAAGFCCSSRWILLQLIGCQLMSLPRLIDDSYLAACSGRSGV